MHAPLRSCSMRPMTKAAALRFWAICALALALPSAALAFDSLFRHVGAGTQLADLFKDSDAYAEVQHGVMLGTGRETWTRLPHGGLRIERSWRYTRARHPEHGTIHKVPVPWEAYG